MQLDLGNNVKVEKEVDSVGGGGFIVDAGIYQGKLEVVYVDYSDKGAMSINVHFKANNKLIKQTVYISSQKGSFTYKDKNSGEEKALPGYADMNALFMALTGKPLNQQTTEAKYVKVWNRDAKAEVAKEVECFIFDNPECAVGIRKISDEKTTKNNEGKYVGIGEFRDVNEFDKFFDHATGLTNVEKAAGETDPKFAKKWKETYVGKEDIRKAKISGVPTGAAPGAPVPAGQTGELFG